LHYWHGLFANPPSLKKWRQKPLLWPKGAGAFEICFRKCSIHLNRLALELAMAAQKVTRQTSEALQTVCDL